MRRKYLGVYLAASMCILLAGLGVSCRRGGDSANRQVVLYCSVDQNIAEPIVAAFQKRTGIEVLARYDTEASKTVGLVQRLRSEARAGRPTADVFWSSEVFYTIRLAREGLLEPYVPPTAEDLPARFIDPQRRWHGFALRARVIAYNTRRVRAEEAPRRLEDLLDARWRGRVVMAAPEFGTTGGDVASWFVHYGTERAEEILRGLKAGGVRLVDGNSTAVRAVARGQADVCLTDTDDVYAAQRNGWPVAMNFLDQGGEGVLVIPNTVALVRGGPHPAEGKALVAFLLSARAEEMLARSDSHNTPARAYLAERFGPYRIPRPLRVDYEAVADRLAEAVRKAREILR